ncbi:MAG: transcription termination factor NusA [Bdellovibrionales bacterium]|nr:transcription termination factor NusA [Bdellovibrionales bacterium]
MDILSNLGRIIDQVSKDKGVNRNIIVNSVIQGVLTAVRKKYGTYRDIEVKYNEDNGQIELFEFKKVVPDEEFEDEEVEIKHSEAKHLDPEVQLEDQIGTRLDLKDLGRIDAQAAKQIIVQNLRTAEHEIIFSEFEKRKGEMASGVVRRMDFNTIVVDLEKTEAYIPRREQIPGEQYKSGDRIQGYILEVRQTTRGPQIVMSRAHEKYLIKLFEAEVPEVYEGIVKIVSAAREPGQRAKMSVYSTDPAVHPVGACVGIKGSRVQNITQELKGERIDIVIWEENPVQYVCNALAPAKIVKVVVNEEEKQMQVIVPDDQLSLAIGKKGQNVRLAVKLTEWNLDLVSESDVETRKREALFNLCLLENMTETMAQSILQYGFSSVQELAQSSATELQSIPGYEDSKKAKELLHSAQALVEQYKKEGKEFPTAEESDQKKSTVSLKEQADEILKRELAQLEKQQETPSDSQEQSVAEEKSGEETAMETVGDQTETSDQKSAEPEEEKKEESQTEGLKKKAKKDEPMG